MNGLLAALIIGAKDWQTPAAVLLAAAALLLSVMYWRSPTDRRTRITAGLLKTLGLVLLAGCLVEPLWSSTRAKPGENLFLLVADDSASLQMQQDKSATRGDWMRKLLADSESSWQVRLAQDFDVRRYDFDTRLESVNSFAELTFDGPSTSLGGVLSGLAARYEGRPLAGILLFTDGNATDEFDAELTERLPPIYPVLVPEGDLPADLSIARVTVQETDFEDAPVTIQMEVEATGLDGQRVTASLLDEKGEPAEQAHQVVEPDKPMAFRFQTRPVKPGLTFYTATIEATRDVGSRSIDEATLANNTRQIAVNRRGEPYRLLYAGGRANWEYKFLARSLRGDDQIQLVTLLRVAKKEPKFEFLGRVGESSNPLFRGFKKEGDEATESYDQAVLLKLDLLDETELSHGFPRDKADLYRYHAVILDDIEAEFFTQDQLSLLERYVAERGGGLMMLGGPNTYRHGGYDRTPVADALPVYVNRLAPAPDQDGYRFRLTRDGWLQPWMRLRATEAEERIRLQTMPPFYSVSRVGSVKPGARIMASVVDSAGEVFPAVVTQQYGAGRVSSVLIGDLWRWSLRRPEGAEDDLAKAWRQMVRWMVADVPRRLDVSVERAPSVAPTAVQLRIRARDVRFDPLDNANLHVTIQGPDGKRVEMDPQPSEEEAGRFDVTYVPREEGRYRTQVRLVDREADEEFSTQVGWTSEPAAEEFRRITVDRQRMEELAAATGGELVTADALEVFVTELPSRRVPITETWLSPLWHQSWVLLLVLACLAGEWGLRRMRGLP